MNHVVFGILAALLVLRGLIFGGLVFVNAVDPSFFTYQNYMMNTLWFLLLVLSLFQKWTFQLWCLLILPLYWGTTAFVGIAISPIIFLNDTIESRGSILNGGTRTLGQLYFGDNIVHQYPLTEVLLVFFLLNRYIQAHFRNFFISTYGLGFAFYSLYLMLSPLVVLLFYMLNFDFLGNYPTPISETGTVLAVIGLTLFLQAILFLILYFNGSMSKNDTPRKVARRGDQRGDKDPYFVAPLKD